MTSVVVVVAGCLGQRLLGSVMTTAPSPRNIVNIVNQSSMIFLSALAAAIGFRMNLFNIGVEGQYTLASFVAAVVAGMALVPGKLNVLLALVVAMVVGAAVGRHRRRAAR